MLNRIDALVWRRLAAAVGAVLLSCVVFAQSATAALIANYDFVTAVGDPSTVTGVLGSTPSASVTIGAGLTAVSTGLGNPARSLFIGGAVEELPAGAVTGDDFLSFTITPGGGSPLDLTALRFDSQISFPTIANTWTLYASTDATIGTQVGTGALAAAASPAVFETATANLTGAASLQNISSAVTFRIYFSGYTSGAESFRIDNIQLDGVDAAVIPEPTSLALLLMGSVMAATRRRR